MSKLENGIIDTINDCKVQGIKPFAIFIGAEAYNILIKEISEDRGKEFEDINYIYDLPLFLCYSLLENEIRVVDIKFVKDFIRDANNIATIGG